MDIQQFAKILDEAALHAKSVEQLSHQQAFSEQEAYSIQIASMQRRYERGEKLIGLKMGFTSKAKMEQMGVHDMIWGRLTDRMFLKDGDTFVMSRGIHPRAEPELCFLVGKKIDRELSLSEIGDYIEGVAAAVEIIDSRYQNFKFSLEDVIADNCSSAGFAVGEWHDHNFPLNNLDMAMEIDGEVVQSGSSAAILGNPWESIVAATRLAHQYGQEIPAGAYLMAGAATPAVYLKAGQTIEVKVERLGTVGFLTV